MHNPDTVFTTALRLQNSGTPYALVSVVKAIPPASSRPGDKAVVTADGSITGWIGGGCAQPAVLRTVRQALLDGKAQMIRIAPAEQGHEKQLGEVLEFGMACHSGGTLELFIDPVLPRAHLVVIGNSPVAQSLSQLAPRVGFAVTVVAHEAEAAAFADAQQVIASDDIAATADRIVGGAWIVVATQGRRDVQGLRLALALRARQISFVASAKKAQVLKSSLIAAGSDTDAVEAIVAPAGYPMAATTPEEIALSVLAAIVSHRHGVMPQAAESASTAKAEASTVDSAGGSCCGGPSSAAASKEAPAASRAVAQATTTSKGGCCGSGAA